MGVFRFIFKLLRYALLAAMGMALAAKFLLESRGGEETQEIDLVTIFGGEELVSSADPFYGGKTLTMFGGTLLDLRKATPAPTAIGAVRAALDVHGRSQLDSPPRLAC